MAVESTTTAPKPNGLKTAIDIIIAPKDALAAIAAGPTWGWAFLIAVAMFVIGTLMLGPAIQHAMTASWPTMVASNPSLAQQSPEQQQRALAIALTFTKFSWIFAPIGLALIMLISTVFMVIFNAIGRGQGSFKLFWAASVNIAIVSGLQPVASGIIAMARGADSFTTMQSPQTAVPSLALLAPAAGVKLATLLGAFTPFSLWAGGLVVATMVIVARVPRVHAWLTGILTLLVPALIASAFAR